MRTCNFQHLTIKNPLSTNQYEICLFNCVGEIRLPNVPKIGGIGWVGVALLLSEKIC
jgi:hypothetical protein